MKPEAGKTYEIRIPRAEGYEYLGEQRAIVDCVAHGIGAYWHVANDALGWSVHERDFIREVEDGE